MVRAESPEYRAEIMGDSSISSSQSSFSVFLKCTVEKDTLSTGKESEVSLWFHYDLQDQSSQHRDVFHGLTLQS